MKRVERESLLPDDLRARVQALPRDVAPPPELWRDIAARLGEVSRTPLSAIPVPSRAWSRGETGRGPFR